MSIYVLCFDRDMPIGGVKILYKFVDALNANGHSASMLHESPGFRCTWFENETRIEYLSNVILGPDDYLVIPEVYGPRIAEWARGIRKIIFNQNAYYTFQDHDPLDGDLLTPYLDREVIAALVVSEDSREYLQYAFPRLKVHRLFYNIDQSLFGYCAKKKPQIAFMPRKNPDDIVQVISMMQLRGLLDGFELVCIDGKTETETARILQDSLIFLSFGYPEGFGMPAAEAMSCGCIVVGFHGMGGREFFKPEFSYPVAQGDIRKYVETVEDVIENYKRDPGMLVEKARHAATFMRTNYSQQRWEKGILDFWKELHDGADHTERFGDNDTAPAEKRHLVDPARGPFQAPEQTEEASSSRMMLDLHDKLKTVGEWGRGLEQEIVAMKAEIEKASAHVNKVERLISEKNEEILRQRSEIAQLRGAASLSGEVDGSQDVLS